MNVGRDGRLNLADLRFVEQADGPRLQRGDVLFNNTNSAELVGKTTWVDVDQELAFSNHMTRLRLPEGVSPEFIARQLHHLWSRGAFEVLCNNHVSQASVSGRTLAEQVELLVPPASEQKRIVAKVEELTARSRRAKEALDAVPPLLDQLRQSILAAAFRGDLTADWRAHNPNVDSTQEWIAKIRAERQDRWEAAQTVEMAEQGRIPADDRWKGRYAPPVRPDITDAPTLPEGWAWLSLAELSWDSGYGTSAKCSHEGTGEPILRIPNVAAGAIDLSDLKHAVASIRVGAKDLLAPGDFLIVRTNGSKALIGRAACVDGAAPGSFFASYLIRFRLLGDGCLWRWISRCWLSPWIRAHIEATAATSAGQYNISLTELARIAIPVPPPNERLELVRILDSALARAEVAELQLREQRVQLDLLESSILAKAFRGELVRQDPNDEPASALLERIRATRTSVEGTASRASRQPRRAGPASEAAGQALANDVTPIRPEPAHAASKDLNSFNPGALLDQVFAALWTVGPLEKDEAVRRVADHLRKAGYVQFERLRSDGPLYASLLDAVEAAVKAGRLDRPRRGHVRACKPDPSDYTTDDWRHALVASIGPDPVDRDDALRAAAEWARGNLGLVFTRLRADGQILEGFRSALNSAIRRGEVLRHDARLISRAPASAQLTPIRVKGSVS